MKAEITTITPEQAEKMLRGNTKNRNMRDRLVEKYALDMASGNWLPNGEAIVMNGRTLIDGQHRLQACIKANTPFRTVLVTGVSLDALHTINTGASRNLSDVLRMNGAEDSRSVAAVVTTGWYWDNGRLSGSHITPSISGLLRWYTENPGVESALDAVRPMRPAPLKVRWAAMAAVIMKAHQHGMRDAADEFIASIISGAGLAETESVFHLRNLLLTQATAHKKLPTTDLHARIVKAWNAYILGEEMGSLLWKSRGSRKFREKFPVMVDEHGNAISYVPADD